MEYKEADPHTEDLFEHEGISFRLEPNPIPNPNHIMQGHRTTASASIRSRCHLILVQLKTREPREPESPVNPRAPSFHLLILSFH